VGKKQNMHHNDTTSIGGSGTNYDALSDTHNVIIGSIALLLGETTIVVKIVSNRLKRHRHSSNEPTAPQVDPRIVSRDNNVMMDDLGM